MGNKVTFAMDGNVAVITLNDAPMNLFDEPIMEGLAEAIEKSLASGCRAAVVNAAGPHFSAGANVNVFRGRSAESARKMFEQYLPSVHAMETAPFPIVAAVQGICAAAGLE